MPDGVLTGAWPLDAAAPPIVPVVAHGLTLEIGGHTLLDGVDLTLGTGGITMVMGPNGAGKSLLLKLLHGLMAPTSGEILCGGRPLSPAVRARQDTLVAAVGTHRHLTGKHELQKSDHDSGRRETALLAKPVRVPRAVTPRQREQSACHHSAAPSVVVALGVGAKGSLITTLVVTPRGHGRLAPLLIRIAIRVVTPRGHGRLAATRATRVATRGPVLRLLRQGVAGHGLERLCVAER
jgi:energy-coupling factor transporter ATP-binding protein EcfA2